MDVEFLVKLVRYWQLSSTISRQLLSAKALQSPAGRLIDTVNRLLKLLQDWYASLPNRFRLLANPASQAATSAVRLDHLLYLHNCFYGGIMAIHAVFTYPWMVRLIDSQKSPALRDQELLSTNAMAEAARCIILATRSIEINGNSPHW